ncbi:MAG: acid shock protein, partial [Oscillospiraceae bacterium]|nr:acid shock protein [Oscillospiraceae bacterium]
MKKVLSLILAMAMVLSFAPQIFAADTGASAEPDITFLPDAENCDYSLKVEAYNHCTFDDTKASRIRFYFDTASDLASWTSFAIRISVPVSGKYALSINAYVNDACKDMGYANVYMAKVDEDKAYNND